MLITNRGDIAKKTPKYTSRSRPYSTNSIPERALQKKGLTYQAKLGDEYANTGPEYSIQDNDYVDPPYRPYALFTFKYRSRGDILQAKPLRLY